MKTIIYSSLLGLAMLTVMSANAESLDDVIKKTLQTNPELQASVQRVHVQQQRLEQARSGYYPSVDLIAGIGRESSENVSTGFNEENLTRQELKLVLRQNIFEGFQTQGLVEQRIAEVDAAMSAVLSDKNTIAQRAAKAYVSVLRDREIITMAQQFVSGHESIYEKIEKRSRSGVGIKSEKQHAQGRLALARSNLITAKANLENSKINFHAIVGSMPADDMSLPAIETINSLDEALSVALKNNPDIAESNSKMTSAMKKREVSRSDYYPEVDVVLSGSRNEDLDGIEGNDDDQLIMLELKYNLFKGGRDQAREQQASFEYERSKFIRDNMYRNVEEDVRYAWNDMQSRRSQLQSLELHLNASIKSRNVYADQYRIGKRSLLDLLDTENELFTARVKHAHAKYSILLSHYELMSAMGALVKQ